MSIVDFVKRTYLTYFSKPKGRRSVYAAAKRHPLKQIVQVGLSDLGFVENLIWLAAQGHEEKTRFVGIDLFEMREPQEPELSLKSAHQRLGSSGAAIKLIPGDPLMALSRNANALTETDLLLVSAHVDEDSMRRGWFYIPRMLHPATLVIRSAGVGEDEVYEQVPLSEVERLAKDGAPSRRRAA